MKKTIKPVKAWAVVFKATPFISFDTNAWIHKSRYLAREEANAHGFKVIPVLITPLTSK